MTDPCESPRPNRGALYFPTLCGGKGPSVACRQPLRRRLSVWSSRATFFLILVAAPQSLPLPPWSACEKSSKKKENLFAKRSYKIVAVWRTYQKKKEKRPNTEAGAAVCGARFREGAPKRGRAASAANERTPQEILETKKKITTNKKRGRGRERAGATGVARPAAPRRRATGQKKKGKSPCTTVGPRAQKGIYLRAKKERRGERLEAPGRTHARPTRPFSTGSHISGGPIR